MKSAIPIFIMQKPYKLVSCDPKLGHILLAFLSDEIIFFLCFQPFRGLASYDHIE
jgi:hypothetical protein